MLQQCRVLYLLSDLVDQKTAEWDDIMAFARPYAALGETMGGSCL
jgi:hypothetical protein